MKNLQTYYESGINNLNSEDYLSAIIDFSFVLEMDSNYKDALFNRGKAFLELNYIDKSIKDFNNVLESDFTDGLKSYLKIGEEKDIPQRYKCKIRALLI